MLFGGQTPLGPGPAAPVKGMVGPETLQGGCHDGTDRRDAGGRGRRWSGHGRGDPRDARGRLWVLTSPTYPHLLPGRKPADKIVILEDTDADSKYDKSTLFMDNVNMPNGIVVWRKGVGIAPTQENYNLWRANFGNTVANINGQMGSAAQANANNLGNIYTQQGANQANMWNNLGSSFGTATGGLCPPA